MLTSTFLLTKLWGTNVLAFGFSMQLPLSQWDTASLTVSNCDISGLSSESTGILWGNDGWNASLGLRLLSFMMFCPLESERLREKIVNYERKPLIKSLPK